MKTARTFINMKKKGQKIALLTAYDANMARIIYEAGVDSVLVGDSLGMVVQGLDRTTAVKLSDVCYHLRCVVQGAPDLHVIADLPFATYEISPEQAFKSASKLIAAGAQMVKIEGGEQLAPTVEFLTQRGIPVCSHVGLLPQSALATGFAIQGKTEQKAKRILNDAIANSQAGATFIVLEAIPAKLAKEITGQTKSATIGIGAGRDCDGQILVTNDVIGISASTPSFARNFLPEGKSVLKALALYVKQVKQNKFPQDQYIPA